MKCKRCGNEDMRYFYQQDGKFYCRKCIAYTRQFVSSTLPTMDQEVIFQKATYHLGFELTSRQKEISKQLLHNYQDHENTILKAVTGSGKTEITYEVIQYALARNQRVAFVIPRKELVEELANRFQKDFRHLNMSVVYGGHHDHLNGQMVICTCHQLYRYPNCFDLLILDEMDAFPYRDDEVLHQILMNSIKGNYIFMSATLVKSDLQLNARYHGYDLPVPKCRIFPNWLCHMFLIYQLYQFKKKKLPVFLFVPTIQDTKHYQRWLTLFHLKSKSVHSKSKAVKQELQFLKDGRMDVLVTTTLLERGITIDQLQVIVVKCQHFVFSQDTLIQIAGRVGRSGLHPTGTVYFLASRMTREMVGCLKDIHRVNA